MKKKRECLVRGRNVYFYGDLALKVDKAIKLSGLTPNKWLDKILKEYIHYRKKGV